MISISGGILSKSKIFQWSKKGSIAILDQVLFNGVHFLISVLLARWLEPTKYGVFAVVYSIFLLLAGFHMAIFTEPMLIYGSGKYKDRFRDYLGVLISKHLLIMVLTGLLLIGTSLFIGSFYSKDMQAALLALSVAIPFILLSWILRRAFYVSMEPEWSAIGGAIYFVLLMVVVSFLKFRHWLSPATYFLGMGFCSLLISLFFIYLLHPVWSFAINTDSINIQNDHLRYGRWALGTNTLIWGTSNVYFVILPAWIGLGGVAALRALMNLSTPIVQTNSALAFLLLPILSHHHAESIVKMDKTVKLFLTLFIGGAIVYFLGLILFGTGIMRVFYGNKYLGLSGLIPLVALLPLGTAITLVLENALRATGKQDKIFWCYLTSTIIAIAGGIMLAPLLGVKGALLGCVASYLAACAMMLIFYKF